MVRLLSQCISWRRASPCHYAQLTSGLRIPLYLLSFPFLARLIVASQGFIILPPWHFGLAFACAALLHASISCLPPFSAPSYALIACRMTAREAWPRCHDISVPIVFGFIRAFDWIAPYLVGFFCCHRVLQVELPPVFSSFSYTSTAFIELLCNVYSSLTSSSASW